MVDFSESYQELANEITIGSIADGELKVTEFFRIFAQLAAENGDCPDLDYTPVLNESGSGYRVDGYAFDLPEGTDDPAGELYLAVCVHYQEEYLPVVNARDVDLAVSQVERFLKAIHSAKTLEAMEESSHAYRLAIQIRQYKPRLARIRVLMFTNGHLKTRRKMFDTRIFGDLPIQINVLDIERYERISRSGSDPVEVEFKEDFEGAISCLPASMGSTGFSSYIFAMQGPVLAKIFATYGSRLLEQNVRTYLQAKTSVNKGILKTIQECPSMFFAYNNGITGTASSVVTERLPDGALGIASIRDFQIVNGGQTTASILYARDAMKCNLDEVYVQVKLSVIGEERLGEVVPKISEYANTQNKVSLADLASNSPVQIRIERLSKEISTPQRAGELHVTRWFYERARGQYRNLFAYKSAAIRSRIETEYPKNQLLVKTDLAKYELAFNGRPHHVSEGEQKCFQRYVTSVLVGYGDGIDLNEFWFKCVVAKAIVFRSLDKEIAQSEWYKAAKGLKAQTVAYSVAAVAQAFRVGEMQIDLMRIWRDQTVPKVLTDWMLGWASRIHKILNDPPGMVKNPSEFAKKEFCWTLYILPLVEAPPEKICDYGVSLSEFGEEVGRGRKEERKNRKLDFDVAIANLVPKAAELRRIATGKNLLSNNNSRALEKLQAGRITLTRAEKNSLIALLERLEVAF
ncbi:AIPR family protein [Deefgea rivuli]|uniref:AIPR family protein n=1 Tax=Deefgea rivuli TaxID=400948 RepID=UPI000685F8D4|nr:AIPR family protein [Deefgea rivuli]